MKPAIKEDPVQNATSKHDHWQRHIRSWHDSELTQRAYCDQHALSLPSFTYWRKRLRGRNATTRTSASVIPVLRSASSHERVVLHSPSGWRIEVPAQQGAAVVQLLLTAHA